MIIPSNIIINSKYTSGNQYMILSSYTNYIGYFYELNGKIFAGKIFDPNATELKQISTVILNPLLTQTSTYVYGKISGINPNIEIPQSYIFNPSDDNQTSILRFFTKKINNKPILIYEISQSTFQQFQNNSIWNVVSLNWNILTGYNKQEVMQKNMIMSGIFDFIYSF